MIKAMRKHPILVAIIGLIIGVVGIVYVPLKNTPIQMTIVRLVLSAIMIGIMILMGGKEKLLKLKDGFGYTLRKCRYILILNYGFSPELITKEISYFVLCITIGLFEEGLFRGVIFQGLVRKTGSTRKGIWMAVIISSLIFGFVHVYTYVIGGRYDLVGIIESIGKTIQTGIIGIILAAVYIKTKNFWAIALVHTLNDFFLMQVVMFANANLGGYVLTGSEGIRTIATYIFQVILYIPAIVKSVKIIKEIEVPEYGTFEEK